MKIYFSGSIAGGRKYLDIYKKIVAHLKQEGHEVLTDHIVIDNIFEFENKLQPAEIFERDIRMLNECDVVIAEVSNPSLGVGYEICYALERQIPTLGLFQPGIFVSRMILGNTSPYLTLSEYNNEKALVEQMETFLQNCCS
jgi:nucleoside 2-deoxyribosyltransferase